MMSGPIAAEWSNTITLGSAIVGIVVTLILLGGIIYTVRRKGRLEGLEEALGLAHGAAESWEAEWKAVTAKADRLRDELAAEKIRCAKETAEVLEEQRELRHDLKNELAAAKLEAETWKQKGDQTLVFEGIKQILDQLSASDPVAGVVEQLEKMDVRAAARDEALLANQKSIVETQERTNTLIDRIVDKVGERVGEVVQEKLEKSG